ncbi:alpha/beta hydrolase [Phytoactinopolyspora limicola]|uniref:alpha/beta hydrolase n=1 Tax=Phytoactinopolyspora limicola TaxID=2715536 RepID=UPI00140E5DB3|nr:dienelactone hydrolase family protein [Phytoactinopolyspora limicola]
MIRDITPTPIVFTSGGDVVAGRVYRQAEKNTERQPAVVIAGSWLTIKEQMATRYAEALARRGYTAITFDFTGWGQSGGELRHAEVPSRKIADIRAAAEYVSTLSFVRPGELGYLGICAGAQYGAAAIATGAAITSFASVAGWFHDTPSVAPFYGGDDGVQLRLTRGQQALDRYQRTGEVITVPAYAPGDERAGMFIELDYYGDPGRGAVPEWANEMAELSWLPWLGFDGMAQAARVSVPTLFVHGDGCVFPDNIQRLRDELAGPVEMVWGDGGQIDFYDQPAQVDFAVEAVGVHFSTTLAQARR